jgi:hypothetical protein
MALPCNIAQWCDRRGVRRYTGKGAVNFTPAVHKPRWWGWLHNRVVSPVLAESIKKPAPAERDNGRGFRLTRAEPFGLKGRERRFHAFPGSSHQT